MLTSKAHEAVIALGSNLGDRASFLRYALTHIGNVKRVSQVFETKAVGGPKDQGPYYNMVIVIETDLSPLDLMNHCLRIEKNAGRERTVLCGPRTLDIDILFYDNLKCESETLTLPHPRIFERPFVTAPLAEVAKERIPESQREKNPYNEVRPLGSIHSV